MDNRIDAIYGRQSIDKKDSISIESQFEFCRYELKGGEAKEYKDKGYSGKNIERPDFQRLLKDIRAGLIRRVIVYKLDRCRSYFSRCFAVLFVIAAYCFFGLRMVVLL